MSDHDYDDGYEYDDYDDEYLEPHRGTTILVLGILGLALSCFVLGIIAWVMGNADLEEMRAGRMDPSGEGLTRAGRICGIISVSLALVTVLFMIFFMMLAGGLALSAR